MVQRTAADPLVWVCAERVVEYIAAEFTHYLWRRVGELRLFEVNRGRVVGRLPNVIVVVW